MLAEKQIYRCIKPVDIGPTLAVLGRLEFADSGGKCAWVTKQDSVAPRELKELVHGLQLGGQHKRMFCRKLMPRQSIAPHTDDWMDPAWRRFHVPLTSNPKIKMRWPEDGVELHLEPGYLYEVRVNREHEVINNTDAERIHIQIDQMGATV